MKSVIQIFNFENLAVFGAGILLVDVKWFILGVSTLRFFLPLYSVCLVAILVLSYEELLI